VSIGELIDVQAGSSNNTVKITNASLLAYFGHPGAGGMYANRMVQLLLEAIGSTSGQYDDIKVPPGTQLYDAHAIIVEQPSGVYANPSEGTIQYGKVTRILGNKAQPDSVTDNGSTITFKIDTLLGDMSGATDDPDQAGRQVVVMLAAPESATESVAIETLTSTWSGTENQVTTTGLLGQDTVSTSQADYLVFLLGPTLFDSAMGPLDTVHLARITSVAAANPITTIDTSFQDVLDVNMSELSEILYKCAHGQVKIGIDMLASEDDTTESQIRVRKSDNTVYFDVDGRGYVTTQKILTDTTIEATGGALTFDDTLVSSPVPFSAGADTALTTYKTNIIGAIKEAQEGHEERLANGVVSGGAVTDGGGTTVDIASMSGWVEGKRRAYPSDSGHSLTPSQTNYVYARSTSNTFGSTTTQATAFNHEHIPIAIVVVGAAAITSIFDIRQYQVKERRVSVKAGDESCDFPTLEDAVRFVSELYVLSSSTWRGAKIILHGEETVTSTIDIAVPRLTIEGSGAEDQKMTWTVAAATGALFNIDAHDVTIRNARFELNTASDGKFLTPESSTQIDNLTLEHCTFSSASGSILWIVQCDDTSRSGWIIKNNRSMDYTVAEGFELGKLTATLVEGNLIRFLDNSADQLAVGMHATGQATIVDNYFLNARIELGAYCQCTDNVVVGHDSISLGIDGDNGDGNIIKGNVINYLAGATPYGITIGEKGIVEGNLIMALTPSSPAGAAIYTASQCSIHGNYIYGNDTAGIVLTGTADYCSVVGNVIDDFSYSGTALDGISVSGDKCVITGNTVTTNTGTGYGIHAETGATSNMIQINSTVSYQDDGTTTLDTTGGNQIG
jgi:parallel beta-helix repeat protein